VSATDTVARLKSSGPHLSIGLLSADLLQLGAELSMLERAGATLVHTDVMDGVFCPQLTVGVPFVRAQRTALLKDVHLMIDEPLDKVGWFVAAGADLITFHPEATRHPHRVLQALRAATNLNDPERGVVRGIAVDPGTPLEVVNPLLDECEYVLVLAVNPGWGGQGFIRAAAERLVAVRELVAKTGRDILVGIDGGVTKANLPSLLDLRPDIVVTGSAVFDGVQAEANAEQMLALTRRGG
jgi:ribulose-phosphate 3-epimerase